MPGSKNPDKELQQFERSLARDLKHLLGYPSSLAYDCAPLFDIFKYPLNNIGDPFVESSYALNSRKYEQEVLAFFAGLYRIPKKESWGYVTSGGTEGNMYGLFVAREMHPKGILYFSEDSHYSIPKIARVLDMRHIMLRSLDNGEIDYEDLEEMIKVHRDHPVILNLNIGTTVKGAIDDLDAVLAILERNKIADFHIHCDAALSGMILPFADCPRAVDFGKPIGSVAISGHKFIGSPMPCGVVLTRKAFVRNIERKIEYIGTKDTTLSGSRSGHAPLILWYAIRKRGPEGFAEEARQCLANARTLYDRLREMEYPCMLNEFSNTVLLKKPPAAIARKWLLAVHGKWAHVVVLQHVDGKKIDAFVKDLKRHA